MPRPMLMTILWEKTYSTRHKNGDVSVPFHLNGYPVSVQFEMGERRSMKRELNGNGTGSFCTAGRACAASQPQPTILALRQTASQAVSST